MRLQVLIKYLKHNAISGAIFLLVILWFYFFKHDISDACIAAAWFIVILIRGYFQFKKRESYLAELEASGLTEETVDNNNFIEKWARIRKKGVYRYYLIDGGMFSGVNFTAVFVFIGIIWPIWWGPLSYPLSFSQLFGICCFLGGVAGIAVNIYFWSANEKKFERLTNSIH